MKNRKTRERYKRLIKLSFAAVMLLGLCWGYHVVWSRYYNETVLQMPFYRRGIWMMVLIYGILLAFFMHTYGGFKIGYLKNGNLIYSQIMSVLFTNVVTYMQIAVIDRRLVNPVYLLPLTIGEIAFIVILEPGFPGYIPESVSAPSDGVYRGRPERLPPDGQDERQRG